MNVQLQTAKLDFRSAFPGDIGNWCWGDVEFPRTSSPRWQDKKGTLEDESVFGPQESYRCFCRMVYGQEFEGDFCPNCWSIIERSDSRKTKFAKIALRQPIPHPFEEVPTDLWVIPVLPAAVREDHEQLDSLYDRIVNNRDSADSVRPLFDEIIARIWPAFSNPSARDAKVILGRGMAITPRHERPSQPLPLWKARTCSRCHARGW